MKDIKIKRICAYVIDIFIVLILVTLLSQINVLNPYKNKYDNEYYKFEMFDNWLNVGYRFTLDRKQVEEFCKYLDKINQYALEHSVPI